MAVSLDFEICQSGSCKTLTFKEQTGAYSASNLGGWGSPNEDTTDAVSATLDVTLPGASVAVQLNLFTASPAYPKSSDLVGYDIASQDLGLATDIAFEDGVYIFTYVVTTSTTIYTQTKTVFLYCNTACCVYSLLADVAKDGCNCNSEAFDTALKAITLLKGLCYAAKCGNQDKFDDYIETINNYCDGCCGDC